MVYDLLIKNGRITDPYSGVDAIGSIAVYKGRIVQYDGISRANCEFDATGHLVLPGIIDFHTHLFTEGSEYGIDPEQLLPTGVTSAVDAGTCGYAVYGSFHRSVIENTSLRIRSLLSINPGVLIGPGAYHTHYIRNAINVPRLKKMKERYGEEIIGLKIMLSIQNVGTDEDQAIALLEETVLAAEEIGNMLVAVHTTNPPCSCGKIAQALRKGDIYCHVFHGQGNTILDKDGSVIPEITEAKRRGVLFDAANGLSHFSLEVASQAISAGFFPDIISTDSTPFTLNHSPRCRSLPHMMSKYLHLGMDLASIIRSVTATPAKAMGMEGCIGTLFPGALADLTVLEEKPIRFKYEDSNGIPAFGDTLLVPRFVVSGGKIVFLSPEFNPV